MKISITSKDYFEELKLMERQYGCEEESYPFINIFLRNGENATDISMRAVAGMTNADNIPGRKLISGDISFPDIAILDKKFELTKIKESENKNLAITINALIKDYNENNNKIYGCVEAKEIETKLFEDLNDKKFIIQFGKCKRYFVKPSSGTPHYYYYIDWINDKPIQIKEFVKKERQGWKLHNSGVKNINVVTDEWYCDEANIKYIECSICDVDNNDIIKIDIKDSNDKLTNEGQIFGELLWYGKVLYTNGLEWKLLEILECNKKKGNDSIYHIREELFKECVLTKRKKWYEIINDKKIKVRCRQIADLTDGYEAYKNSNNQLTSEQENEWNKLIKGLAEIKWLPEQTKED